MRWQAGTATSCNTRLHEPWLFDGPLFVSAIRKSSFGIFIVFSPRAAVLIAQTNTRRSRERPGSEIIEETQGRAAGGISKRPEDEGKICHRPENKSPRAGQKKIVLMAGKNIARTQALQGLRKPLLRIGKRNAENC
jgi:hypothetical protein